MSEAQENYEIVRKVLTYFEYGKSTTLRWLVSKTGMSYETLMQLLKPAVKAGLLSRSPDDKEIAYTLRHLEYDAMLARCYGVSEVQNNNEISSADSVQMRTKNTTLVKSSAEQGDGAASNVSQRSQVVRRRVMASVRESSASNERIKAERQESEKPASESERRSSMELQFFDRRRSQQMTANAVPGRNIPLTGAYKSVPSSSSLSGVHKSIYINHVSNTHPAAPSRSMYASRAPQASYGDFHRTDTDFPMKHVSELPQRMAPILSGHVTGSVRTEYSEELIRAMIGRDEGLPIFAIDSDKTCFELWSCFSAVSNSGGGIILLGVRRHGISYVIRKNPKFDDLVLSVIREFNDRTVISDAPKCRECLECTDENAGFISKCHDGKKAFLVIRVNADVLNRMHLPVYTKLDSFGSRKDGCYRINSEREIVRCSDAETKALWERFYLKNERADWEQTGEMLDVDMSRKLRFEKIEQPEDKDPYLTPRLIQKQERKAAEKSKENLESDDRVSVNQAEASEASASVAEKRAEAASTAKPKAGEGSPRRVASRAFGEESPRMKFADAAKMAASQATQTDDEASREEKGNGTQKSLFDTQNVSEQAAKSPSNSAESIRAAMLWAGDIRPSQNTLASIRARVPNFQSDLLDVPPTVEQQKALRSDKIAQANAEKAAMNEALKAEILRNEERQKQEMRRKAAEAEKSKTKPSTADVPSEVKSPAKRGRKPRAAIVASTTEAFPENMPPVYDEAKREEYDKIAEPAIMFPRLQAARLCAIATKLLRCVSLTLPQLCEIMKRAQPSIKKNVIAALENDPHFKSFDQYYYYIDD